MKANYFEQLPTWAKGVTGVVIVGGAVFIAIGIYKALKAIKGDSERRDVKGEIKTEEKKGIKPSFSDANYNTFANKIHQAGFVLGGTDEDAMYDVFKQMKNELDILKLIEAFGKRRIEFSFQESDLGGFLASELDSDEIKEINTILADKNIKYRF